MAIDAKLNVPNEVTVNLMPPVPNRVLVPVPVAAFLKNQGSNQETSFAATPCDVHYWEIVDSNGNLVQSEAPEACIQMIVTRPLKAGETIRGDNTLPLNGKLLKNGQRYTIRYKFWGFYAEGSFVVRVVM